MPAPRRFQDIDAGGHREPPGAFTAAAARLKRDRIERYARAYAMQAPIKYEIEPDDDESETDR